GRDLEFGSTFEISGHYFETYA
ncbi:hypothetical protein LCGC14_1875280, partial [marine sediment metagenome]